MKKRIWIILVTILLAAAIAVALYFIVGCSSSKKLVPTRYGHTTWLELPTTVKYECEHCETHYAMMQGRLQRNYTFMYDFETYSSFWVAYPLHHSHMHGKRNDSWSYDPKVPRDMQTSVSRGYGADCPTENYPGNFYARGHQLPDADRSGVPSMQAQTYFSTNMTPQLQNGFNGAIWKELEEAVRNSVPQDDTLYVVTGASFNKKGEDLPVEKIRNRNDGKEIPVPNYYWKVLLKVSRTDGKIEDASAIGFWMPHKDLKDHDYRSYVVSVDQIEEWLGTDFFVNLDKGLQKKSETCSDWTAFRNFNR